MTSHRAGPKGHAKVVYKTPGRECAHADRGCCPKCLDPMFLLGRKLKKHNTK